MLKLFVSLIIFFASVFLCYEYISNSISNQNFKKDYGELNSVKYGLISVEEWKRQITLILTDEINQLDLSVDNEQDLRTHIETVLNSLIDEGDKKIRQGNSKSAIGWIKQNFINMFISKKNIKKGIPEYTDVILNEMIKSETKNQIKSSLIDKLNLYNTNTFDAPDTSQISQILLRTHSRDIKTARTILKKAITGNSNLIVKEAMLLIVLAVILFLLVGFSKRPLEPSQYILLVLSLIILLAGGITTPMIDMEAKISQITFILMGHPIHFENQVLFFQSKSILDLFWIMITHKDVQMKLVGVLLITFSIFFPLLKITSSLIYYYNYHKARDNPVIKFFVLKSGKWSMTDVMVVAIFMAYIGFNGIISSQLGQLSRTDQNLVILTTNGTSLQPGFYLFLTYCLLGGVLSEFIKRKPSAA